MLLCADGTYYAGSTSNIARRLHEHNHAKAGAHYTKIRRPVTLAYVEHFATLAQARAREHEFKNLTREQKQHLCESAQE